MTETDLWMCQEEVIDDLDKSSFNGVAETKAWLESRLRGNGGEDRGGRKQGRAGEGIGSRESLFSR